MRPRVRLLGRHFEILKLKHPQIVHHRGGQLTPWPWWSIQLGRFELIVSRTKPRGD